MKIDEQEFVQYLTIKKHLAPKSVDTYKIRFLVVQRWLVENKTDLNKISFEKFLFELKEKELSNSTLNTYIQAIKHLDGFCKDRGLPAGFTDGIENLPKTQSDISILSNDEMNLLLSTHLEYKNRNGVNCEDLDFKYLTLTQFLAITGSRFGEATTLRIKRLDIENGKATLVNTKNRKNRYIYFEGPIKQSLKLLIQGRNPDDLVFTNSKDQFIKPGDFNIDLRLRAKKAGINKRVHAHLLRHCYGTQLVIADVDIAKVATLMGHRDIRTTFETYVHLADDTLQKASMRNPLVRQYVEPSEILKSLKESFDSYQLVNDKRFKFEITQTEGEFRCSVIVKSVT